MTWLVTNHSFQQWLAIRGYEDKGLLRQNGHELLFEGRSGPLRMQLNRVEFVGPLLTKRGIVTISVSNVLVIIASAAGAFLFFTLTNPLTYVALVLLNSFYMLGIVPMRWVKVSYTNSDGKTAEAYFTLASTSARMTYGAHKLFDIVKSRFDKAASTDSSR